MQHKMEQRVLRAQTDAAEKEQLIREYEAYICRAASRTAGHEVVRGDNAWSMAIFAFSQAIDSFGVEKGRFLPYAELLIRHRLSDYYRHQRRFSPADGTDAQAQEAAGGNAAAAGAFTALQSAAAGEARNISREIQAASRLFQQYGFQFFDLAACSPRTDKTRSRCAKAINAMLKSDILMLRMQSLMQLPVAELQKSTGLPRKTLEQYRIYIIAATELLAGDYPCLAEYFDGIRKEAVT